MENIIESLLQSFEKGKMNRRQLVRSLAVAASASAVVSSVPAFGAEAPLPITKLDHLSYTVADYGKSRDFYNGLLGLKVLEDDGKRQARMSTGNTTLIARAGGAGKRTGYIDHIGYSCDLKDKNAIFAAIKARGFTPVAMEAKETGVHVMDPDGFNVQINPKK